MSLSSICVVSNALRLRTFKPKNIVVDKNEISEYKTIVPDINEINTKIVKIEGMMCDHCVARVKSALKSISDKPVTVTLSDNSAVVDETLDNKEITEAITKAGYKVIEIK